MAKIKEELKFVSGGFDSPIIKVDPGTEYSDINKQQDEKEDIIPNYQIAIIYLDNYRKYFKQQYQ